MRILVVNDDGIDSKGIEKLAAMACSLGSVYVVAPDSQCSAMSQKITVRGEMQLKKRQFPVENVQAYSLSGTPADCVKVAVEYLMDAKPDVVFSGINQGYNIGLEVAYSGTVAAAMEAIFKGIPAIAFSVEMNEIYDVTDEYLLPLTKELLTKEIAPNEIWNVNFPGCRLEEYRGTLWNRTLGQTQFFLDHYDAKDISTDVQKLSLAGVPVTKALEGTDIRAVMDRYISVGKIRSMILQ